MLSDERILVDERMQALKRAHEAERAVDEARYVAREAALAATIREEDHFAQKGHHMIGGDAGRCAVCEEQVFPHA
jgi:hypothetical protein